MNQKERVINYINLFGSISPLEAFKDLGITKLATVVSNLKKDGVKIFQCIETSRNRYGEPCWYMRYFLNKNIFNIYEKTSYSHLPSDKEMDAMDEYFNGVKK